MKKLKEILGPALTCIYFLQYWLSVKWNYLELLQGNQNFKRWSGLVLILLIIIQWSLSLGRIVYEIKDQTKLRIVNFHKWIGALAPVLFYLHSIKPGYGILFFLTTIFFLDLIGGYLNYIHYFKSISRYYFLWLLFHILLSVVVLIVALLHIWIVFSYK